MLYELIKYGLAGRPPIDGRPFRKRFRIWKPAVGRAVGWSAPLKTAPSLRLPEIRKSAQEEHASIAAFADLSKQLVELGAPADLVAGAHRAALEEIDHARQCFSLLSQASGKEIGPVRRKGVIARLRDDLRLSRMATESVFDGLLSEGISAQRLLRQAEGCEDPTLREILVRTAKEEEGHAALAGKIFEWSYDQIENPFLKSACKRAIRRRLGWISSRSGEAKVREKAQRIQEMLGFTP